MGIILTPQEKRYQQQRNQAARIAADGAVQHLMTQVMPDEGYAFILESVAGAGFTPEQQAQINSVICRLVQGLPVTAEDVNKVLTLDKMVELVSQELYNSYGCAQ